jgi:uncharacterized protein
LAQLLSPADLAGRTRLLVLQPTPFCNIDCEYCYLPARNDHSRMPLRTIHAAVDWIYSHGLAAADLTVVWHAGEPLVLPAAWYHDAIAACAGAAPRGVSIRHAIQTNATLITDAWCDLFLRYNVNVGVSLDGPQWLHDRYRKDRRGTGTHAAAMRGVGLLQHYGIPFHAIAVVTAEALDAADAVMDFFGAVGVTEIGFNIDEQEGIRARSSLTGDNLRQRFAIFLQRALVRAEQPGAPMVREARNIFSAILDPSFETSVGNDENEPFRIVTVLCNGRFSTFSPELAGFRHHRLGDLTFGNVHTDRLDDVLVGEHFWDIAAEVASGVASCRAACPYFRLCRGGAPANKLAELDTFAGTETQHCRLAHQGVAEVVLNRISAALRSSEQVPIAGVDGKNEIRSSWRNWRRRSSGSSSSVAHYSLVGN